MRTEAGSPAESRVEAVATEATRTRRGGGSRGDGGRGDPQRWGEKTSEGRSGPGEIAGVGWSSPARWASKRKGNAARGGIPRGSPARGKYRDPAGFRSFQTEPKGENFHLLPPVRRAPALGLELTRGILVIHRVFNCL